jgi:hypothetical protein
LTKGAERFEVSLTRDQFAEVGRNIHRQIMTLVHELRPAGAPVTLVAPAILGDFPGLRAELELFVGCELISVPDGHAAAAISLLELPRRAPEDPVRLLRKLPCAAREPAGTRVMLGEGRAHSAAPSHLLLDGQVYALGGAPLVLGRSPAGPHTIKLAEGLAGVSRRHCTLVPEGNEVILLDHSSFGTFVNGERVAERVRVRTGDRVRLGDPGIELSLLTVNEAPLAREQNRLL